MKKRKREIAKVGIFGTKDNPQIVTENELKEIAETFPEIKKAPVSLSGHWPDASSPRLGNVVSVSYDETTKTLTGEIEEEDTLAEAVDAGYYPDVSIGARQRASDSKMYLHHLAYLGEEPPAIKDLVKEIKEDLKIAASDKGLSRRFPSTSEKQLYLSDTPPENLLGGSPNENKKESTPASESVSEVGSGEDSANLTGKAGTSKESSMTEAEQKALQEKADRLEAENKKLQDENKLALSDAEKQKKESDLARLKTAMESKKIPNPIREKALRLCDALDNAKTIELSDTEAPEGKRKVSTVDCLIELVNSFTPAVTEGAMNLSDGENAAAADANRVKLSNV
ncbi:MAG: hypothetical protein FWC19_06415 [Treponema sp.]|nr:hypothetical protein [Treponema sp.]MCL2272417.1 hypothetical protein [Treponema sp.]